MIYTLPHVCTVQASPSLQLKRLQRMAFLTNGSLWTLVNSFLMSTRKAIITKSVPANTSPLLMGGCHILGNLSGGPERSIWRSSALKISRLKKQPSFLRLKSGQKWSPHENNNRWISFCQRAQASVSNLYHIDTSDVTALGLYIIQLQKCDFHYAIKVLVVITMPLILPADVPSSSTVLAGARPPLLWYPKFPDLGAPFVLLI